MTLLPRQYTKLLALMPMHGSILIMACVIVSLVAAPLDYSPALATSVTQVLVIFLVA